MHYGPAIARFDTARDKRDYGRADVQHRRLFRRARRARHSGRRRAAGAALAGEPGARLSGRGRDPGPLGLGSFTEELPVLHWVTVVDAKNVAGIAELGVVFLMFLIGLELSFER